jgi:hypothetical protein
MRRSPVLGLHVLLLLFSFFSLQRAHARGCGDEVVIMGRPATSDWTPLGAQPKDKAAEGTPPRPAVDDLVS